MLRVTIKDIYRDVECVVPLRKEEAKRIIQLSYNTNEFSARPYSYSKLLSDLDDYKKEGAKSGSLVNNTTIDTCPHTREIGGDRFGQVNTLLQSAQRDNCIKLRGIILNDNNKENAQVQANMTVVHNILNGGTEVSVSREVELAVAA